jgi:hypothetical protein
MTGARRGWCWRWRPPEGRALRAPGWAARNILERYPDADLRVYVVWVQRWASDTRTEIDGAGLVDRRVTHLWDAGKMIGQPFLERFGVDYGGLDYDFSCCSAPIGGRRHRGQPVRARR